jgi:hypothetical protein
VARTDRALDYNATRGISAARTTAEEIRMNRKGLGLAVVFTAVAAVTGCAYVSETPEGQTVRVVQAADVAQCKHLGNTRVSVVQMARGEKFVREDLIRLARNSAAKSGADTIVATGEPKDGEQTFDMYRCINP